MQIGQIFGACSGRHALVIPGRFLVARYRLGIVTGGLLREEEMFGMMV